MFAPTAINWPQASNFAVDKETLQTAQICRQLAARLEPLDGLRHTRWPYSCLPSPPVAASFGTVASRFTRLCCLDLASATRSAALRHSCFWVGVHLAPAAAGIRRLARRLYRCVLMQEGNIRKTLGRPFLVRTPKRPKRMTVNLPPADRTAAAGARGAFTQHHYRPNASYTTSSTAGLS